MEIEVIRCKRRVRTVQAGIHDGKLRIRIPGAMSVADEKKWVLRLEEEFSKKLSLLQRSPQDRLQALAEKINREYFSAELVYEIRWSKRQRRCWGSCTPARGTIRISVEAAALPDHILGFVVYHELCHLIHANHSPSFQELLNRYKNAAFCKGYLAGWNDHRNSGTRCSRSEPEALR